MLRLRLLTLSVCFILPHNPLAAHELGGASVRMTLKGNPIQGDRLPASLAMSPRTSAGTRATLGRAGVFGEVRVEVDPEHLPLSLNPYSGLGPAASNLEGRAEGFMRSYMAHLHLNCGGPVRPSDASLEPLPADPAHHRFVFHFSVPLPQPSQPLTWEQDLPLGQYFFVLGDEKGGAELKLWMEGGRAREVALAPLVRPANRLDLILSYVHLGFTHILPEGLDHILFVLGIFLLTLELRSILWQVTAFTLAHSITLGLSLYGVVSLRPSVVEPLIALSIVAVAVENVWVKAFHWRRVAVVFGFGLLHGLGFAGALRDLGLPRSEFLTALLGFNGGVELGQISVVLLAFLSLGLPFGPKTWYRSRIAVPASILIGCAGAFWAVQRVFFV